MRPTVKAVLSVILCVACSGAGGGEEGGDAPASALRASLRCDEGDAGRQVLPANDGWAALYGVTGGSLATAEQTYVVTSRSELIAALNDGVSSPTSPSNPSNAPKIIYVHGSIDFNVDEANEPLDCSDYYRGGFTWEAFDAAYDPAIWGRKLPSGPLEDARLLSRTAQQERVRIRVGSNTTLIGLGGDARLRGVWLDLRGTPYQADTRTNIIVRNLTFQDTFDCFPQWSPQDGALGSWNALYDSISLRDTTNVWIDSNTFEDRVTADSKQPLHFGVRFQPHDGLLDITNASDLVTVSWNRFRYHDKAMLIGSGDTAIADRGKLRVTLHHNLFDGISQRAPRVRFGQVHVYDNYYKVERLPGYIYSWGIGVESSLYAQNNFFKTDKTVAPSQLIAAYGGTQLFESGSHLNGTSRKSRFDPVAAYNDAHDPDLLVSTDFSPTLFTEIDPTPLVPQLVQDHAGAGHL